MINLLGKTSTADSYTFYRLFVVDCEETWFERLREEYRKLQPQNLAPLPKALEEQVANPNWRNFLRFLAANGHQIELTSSAIEGLERNDPENDAALEAIGLCRPVASFLNSQQGDSV